MISLLAILRRPSHFVNALSNWGAMGVEAVLAFFITPFIIHYLGKEGYGIWILIVSIVGYYGFLDLGIGTALMRYVSRYAAQGKDRSVEETVSTALLIFCITGTFIVICSYFSALPLANVLNISEQNAEGFVTAIRFLGIAMAIRLIGDVFKVTLLAHELFVVSNVVVILNSLLRAAMTLSLLYYGWGLLGVAVSHLASSILISILYFFVCRRFIPVVRVKFSSVNKDVSSNLLKFGGITVLIAITDTIRLNLDSFVIAKVVNVASVGIYGIAAILVRYFRQLVVSAMGVFTPRFAALSGSNSETKLANTFLRSLFVCSLLAFSLATILLSCGGDFILLWVGDEFRPSIQIVYFLVAGHLVAVSQNVAIGMMYGKKKHHWYAVTSSVEALFNLLLSIVLGMRYGILGVALGTVIPMVIIRGFFQPFYVSRILHISVISYYSYLIPGAVLGGGSVAFVAFIGSRLFSLDNYFFLGMQAALSFIFSALFLFVVIKFFSYLQRIGPWKIRLTV